MHLRGRFPVAALLVLTAVSAPALAQDAPANLSDQPEWVQQLGIDPAGEQARAFAAEQKTRAQAEKQLRKLRLKYFGPIRKAEIRQEGLLKLREFDDPALYSLMLELFAREQDDVRLSVLDMCRDSQCAQGDATLVWAGLFDRDEKYRQAAIRRLSARIKDVEQVPWHVKHVIFEGLRSRDEGARVRAAGLSRELTIVEAIPWLIVGQVQISNGGGFDASRDGALAWIFVGQQTAYVSDLTPVVSEGAVAFDPQMSAVVSGSVVRIVDAAVVTYQVDLHNELVRLSTKAWGEPTDHLGWDTRAWIRWHEDTFVPFWENKQREEQLARAAAIEAQKTIDTAQAEKDAAEAGAPARPQ